MKKPKVALVYDRINKFGGAERVLLALHAIWPDAPLYSAVYDHNAASWASGFRIHPTFMQRIPFAKSRHELFAWLTPMAFESISFDGYDVVISVTSAEAKNIITKPGTLHICYCLTPTRYLWSGITDYRSNPNIGIPNWLVRPGYNAMVSRLKSWDLIASCRPDRYIAISDTVASRIHTFYKKSVSKVIYPPVDVRAFSENRETRNSRNNGKYFLCVSRLVPYKRVDLVIEAFNELGWPLLIIGDGLERNKLVRRAKQNIRFIPNVTDSELISFYRGAKAFVFAGVEDFGIAAVEAQACGIPVIAYNAGGYAEIVRNGETGLLYDDQTAASLVSALKKFPKEWYDDISCVKNAERFSAPRFNQQMKDTVEELYNMSI